MPKTGRYSNASAASISPLFSSSSCRRPCILAACNVLSSLQPYSFSSCCCLVVMAYWNRNWVAVKFRCLLMNDLLLVVGINAASEVVHVFVFMAVAASTAATGVMHFVASDQISIELFLFSFRSFIVLVEIRCFVCPWATSLFFMFIIYFTRTNVCMYIHTYVVC